MDRVILFYQMIFLKTAAPIERLLRYKPTIIEIIIETIIGITSDTLAHSLNIHLLKTHSLSIHSLKIIH